MSNFVICINNDSNPASLLVGKVYRTLPDEEAERKLYKMAKLLNHAKSGTHFRHFSPLTPSFPSQRSSG